MFKKMFLFAKLTRMPMNYRPNGKLYCNNYFKIIIELQYPNILG